MVFATTKFQESCSSHGLHHADDMTTFSGLPKDQYPREQASAIMSSDEISSHFSLLI